MNLSNEFILLLVCLFVVKHFICDFPLQNICDNWIIKTKGSREFDEWVPSLLVHSMLHALVTAIILSIVFSSQLDSRMLFENVLWPKLALVCLLEFVAHFIIDRAKAHPDIGGRFKPDQIYFWWALGLDQMLHYLTYAVMIHILIN
jgi:hypothetical protein